MPQHSQWKVPSWYSKLFPALKEIGCSLPKGKPESGERISFTVLGGGVQELHYGKICIPDRVRVKAIEMILNTMKGSAWLPLHEMAANGPFVPRVFVTEVDLKLSLEKSADIVFLAKFCGKFLEGLDKSETWNEIFNDERTLDLPLTTERVNELGMMELLEEQGQGLTCEQENGDIHISAKVTWLDVLKLMPACVGMEAKLPNVFRKEWCIKLFTSMFGMAYGMVVRRAVCTFYPKLEEGNHGRSVAVLTNHGPNAYVPDKEKNRYNFGVHTCSSHIIVTEREAHRLIDEIYYILETDGEFNTYIKGMVDRGIYNNGGGLRPPYAQKPVECHVCRGTPIEPRCPRCQGYGSLPAGRWYGPTAFINPWGTGFMYSVTWFLQRNIVMKVTTATALLGVEITEGIFDTVPVRTLTTEVAQKRKGVSMAVNRAAKRIGLDPKIDDTEELLCSINAHQSTVGRTTNTFPLSDASLQFNSIRVNFPRLIAMLFGGFGTFIVKSVMIKLEDSKPEAQPIQLYVYLDPKTFGGKGRMCFNRRPKRTHLPGRGRHNNAGCVYFVITREDLTFNGRCTITQKCNNIKHDPLTRIKGPCCEWEGETRILEIPVSAIQKMTNKSKVDDEEKRMREIARTWFYPQTQRTEEHLRQVMCTYRSSIHKRYNPRKPHPHIIGPHEKYYQEICDLSL
jgi:hypothetical protein